MIGVVSMVYNHAQFLRRALDSLLEQTYSRWILAITDDGSTDETPQILKEYADRDDRIVVLKIEHSGVAKAFNNSLRFLLENTDVDYIARLDADDYFFKWSLEGLINFASAEKAEVVHADHIELRFDGREWYVSGYSVTPKEQPSPGQLLRFYNVISGGSVLIRRKFLETIPSVHRDPDPYWDEELKGGWDVDWWIRMLIAGATFKKLNAPIYVHRVHEKSMFAESLRGRWLEWRRQLWNRREIYREMAIRRLLK